MIFTTFSFLLAGLVATSIPIAIHLLSRGKPKKIVFPALRFAQAKLAENKRKLTVKRLLLLTLRALLFVTLGLALARPYFARQTPKPLVESTVAEEDAAPDAGSGASGESAGISGRDAPVATAIVIDTSVRMSRVKDNQPLLDQALATARAILDQTSKGSEIAILDGTTDGDAFQPDRFAAKSRLDKIAIDPTGRSAAQSTLEALALVERSELAAREIFVLTDSTQASWQERDVARLKRQLTRDDASAAPTLYFVDLGDDEYRNASIVDLALSAETVAADSGLRVDVELERVAPSASDVSLELVLFDVKKLPNDLTAPTLFNDPKLTLRRETQIVSFGEGRTKRSVNFQTSDLPVGTCVGAVRIVGGDALAADDVRWFAVDVVPEWRLLVVAPEPIDSKALFLSQALAPEDLRRSGRAPFELDVVPYARHEKTQDARADKRAPRDLFSATADELTRYRAIFLLDPPGLDGKAVAKLTTFVDDGGGLGVFLGRNAKPIEAFQTPEAIRLFGYKPTTQTRAPNWDRAFAPDDYSAPILASFRPFARQGIPWDAAPIGRFWQLTELADTSNVVANIAPIESPGGSKQDKEKTSDGAPGIVENRVGRGLVATLATPISDSAQESPWNALTDGDAAWIFVVLVDGFARRLASSSSSILNYTTGEIATLRAPIKNFPARATLRTPTGDEIATPTDVERRQLRFPGLKTPGLYRAQTTPNRDGESIDLAFAVATSSREFDLTRYSPDDWSRLWDGAPYKTLDLHASGDALETARRGKESEPYGFLIVLLASLFLVESGVANRFYKN